MRRPLRLLAVTAVVIAASLSAAASAMGATGALVGTNMVYNGEGAETNRAIVRLVDFSGSPHYEVFDPGADIVAETPCLDEADGTANSNTMDCPANLVASFSASLGDGNDQITIQTGAELPTSIGAGGGLDTMQGGVANDFLRGGDGRDAIDGGAGNDQIVGDNPGDLTGDDDALSGGAGSDTLNGNGGNDTFTTAAAPDGSDVYHGDPGTDTVTYSNRTQPVNVILDGHSHDGEPGEDDNVHSDTENIIGGQAGDSLTGSGDGNTVDGGPGDDALSGLEGADSLFGGPGGDTAAGGADGDLLDGGDGSDTLNGEAGTDTLAGGADPDALSGGGENDLLDGGGGTDALAGGDQDDALAGGDDADSLSGDAGNDSLKGDAGDDTLDGGAGGDSMAGGDGPHDLATYASRSAAVSVSLDGQGGDGEIGEGDNVQPDVENLTGGSGDDSFEGSTAANLLDGGAGGEDYIDADKGADTILGGDKGDVARTRDGEADTIACGPGPDFVVGDAQDKPAADCDRVDRGVRQKPKRRDSVLVTPSARAPLSMSPKGIVREVPLLDKIVLQLGSGLNTTVANSSLKVTATPNGKKLETATLTHGAFDVNQLAGKLPVTQFTLDRGDFTVCPAVSRRTRGRASAAAKAKVVRRLWTTGKGRFRTKGRYAAAAVRGTRWLTEDRCDGTNIRVTQGAVSVTDLVRKRTVVVRAGDSYFAAARR